MNEIINSYLKKNTGNEYNDNLEQISVYNAGLDSLLLVGLLVELEAHTGKMLSEESLAMLITDDFTFGDILNAFK